MRSTRKTVERTATSPVQFYTGDLVTVSMDFTMIMTEKTIPMYVDDPYNLMLSELRQKSTETRKINTWMPDVIKKLKYGDTAIIFHPGKHLYAFVLAEDHFGWVMKSMIGKIDASD